ncbi:hypothetical protein Rhopal_005305-T1 [Rhodotorula paludigena]|uniref:Uncharacterized protein n=1 Tax=Rhodotorula paludigena TaxID=86838 RepID=A0AAV5GQW0_9BASI|nr:hypothetical protein Rhopal_005305-T1 [Rhodotorula paludigena]
MPAPPPHRSSDSLTTPTRAGRPSHQSSASVGLSPISVYSYSETDPFLSPTSPRFFHPTSPTSPTWTGPTSPTRPDLRRTSSSPGILGALPLVHPPKRHRNRLYLVLVALAFLLALALVRFTQLPAPLEHKLEIYSARVGNGLARLASGSGVTQQEVEGVAAQEDDVFEVNETGEIRIRTTPRPRMISETGAEDVKYLGFLPHSGFHNQRIALQNALLLGKALNRTVLIPPIWVGWPIPTQFYSDLRKSWLDIMLSTPPSFDLGKSLTAKSPLNPPADFASSVTDFPCADCFADNTTWLASARAATERKQAKWREAGYEVRPDGYPIIPNLRPEDCKSYSAECRFTYRDTFLAYDFLVDLDEARKVGVEVVDRWDMRERALLNSLNVTQDDVYIIEDRQAFDFRFTDQHKYDDGDVPLIQPNLDPEDQRYNRHVSIDGLSALPHRVLLVGSLFGSGRVRLWHEPDAYDWSERLARAMAFRNPWLMRPADAIVARLGGRENYVGVHARVGDGEFQRYAARNMEQAWRDLVEGEMGLSSDVVEEMWNRVKPNVVVQPARSHSSHVPMTRRSSMHASPGSRNPWMLDDDDYTLEKLEQSRSRRKKRGLLDEVKALLPSTLWGADPSSRLQNLTCRAPLHTESRFKPFNVPLYLATDSRAPEADINLAPFFAAFPCTFLLSDFDRAQPERNDGLIVESVEQMGRLVNDLDGVPLGRLFLPFLEAIIASKGRLAVGTQHSTFSGFVQKHLHEAYWLD